MNTDNKISRRDFIKTSVAAGGALLASTTISGAGDESVARPEER